MHHLNRSSYYGSKFLDPAKTAEGKGFRKNSKEEEFEGDDVEEEFEGADASTDVL